jgi:murein DD-endopeptidase MepM/ murein hydrolase activator NlpD
MSEINFFNVRALLALAASVALFVAACAAVAGSADARSASELQSRIASKQSRAAALTDDIDSMSSRISGLRGRINKLQATQNRIQRDLDVKLARQREVANDLSISRDRLKRLKRKLAHSREVLSERIVEVYKQGQPNMIDVVLNSDGFADVVTRATYMRRIAAQDQEVIAEVTGLKGKTEKETTKLAKLEKEASKLVAEVRDRRNEVAAAKRPLTRQRSQLASAVDSRKSKLAKVSRSLAHDQEDLAKMMAANSGIVGALDNSAPIKKGSGQLDWPVNGQFTSPFGGRWGRLHAGIDIAVPTGTAVHAADGGTVRIAGFVGGYGNYICIQHTGSLSTCYGHNSRLMVSVGQSVRKGQVIAASGNTGHSTGPHVHFEVRVNGNPVDPMGYL